MPDFKLSGGFPTADDGEISTTDIRVLPSGGGPPAVVLHLHRSTSDEKARLLRDLLDEHVRSVTVQNI